MKDKKLDKLHRKTEELSARQIKNKITKLEQELVPKQTLIREYREQMWEQDRVETINEGELWDEKLDEFFQSIAFEQPKLKIIRSSRFEAFQQRGLELRGSNKDKKCGLSIEVTRDTHSCHNSYFSTFELSEAIKNINYYVCDICDLYFDATPAGTKRFNKFLQKVAIWLNT